MIPMARWKSAGVIAALGLCSSRPEAVGLQTGGPVRIVRRRPRPPSSPPVPSKGGVDAGKGPAPTSVLTFESRDMFKVSKMAGRRRGRRRRSKNRSGGGSSLTTSSPVTSTSVAGGGARSRKMRQRLQSKVKDAGKVPDLSRMLRNGLPYLTRNEATAVQLALAVSLYAHSKSKHDHHDHRVKVGVEVCLQLGRLRMGTDALLAAILSGVLRPGIVSEQPLGFGRAPVTLTDIRQGFGPNVARLVAGLEHVTCVEETAHSILRGTRGVLEEDGEALSSSLLIGVGARESGGRGSSDGSGGRKGGGLREASVLEQGERLRNLIVSEAADWQVLTLRLAVNLQALKQAVGHDANAASKQLARDALIVHGPLAHRLGVHQLRNDLETAAFRRLFPDQFNEVRRATEDRSSVYEKIVEATKEILLEALKNAPAFMNQLSGDVVLQHRIKSPYSMWKKMEKKKVTVEGVFDALAIRVVLEARKWQGESIESYTARSEDLCYQAMSVIQRLYPSAERRIKDYVAKPKGNGYQSLHATLFVPDVATHGPPVPVEFQVRSKEMHQMAEFGLAAHWSYKGSGSMSSSLDWIANDSSGSFNDTGPGKAVVPDSVTSGRELVDWLHRELQQRKVFVFGPDKRIWELDKSSATAAHVLGRSCMQSFYEGAVLHGHRKRDWFGGGGFGSRTTAWVNGQEVDPSYLLKNGDVFDVQGTAGPPPPKTRYSKVQIEAALNASSKC